MRISDWSSDVCSSDLHEFVRDDLAAVVGAQPSEVVAMNTLGVNLHLMMVSFYRPTAERPAILIEAGAFPTDRYAVESQIRFHGFDPATALIDMEAAETTRTTAHGVGNEGGRTGRP